MEQEVSLLTRSLTNINWLPDFIWLMTMLSRGSCLLTLLMILMRDLLDPLLDLPAAMDGFVSTGGLPL